MLLYTVSEGEETTSMKDRIQNGKGVFGMLFLPQEEGQGLVEYALILVLVAIVVIAVLLLLGPAIGNVFSRVMGYL